MEETKDDVVVRLTDVRPGRDGSTFVLEFWLINGKDGPYLDFLSGTWSGSMELQGDKLIISKRK